MLVSGSPEPELLQIFGQLVPGGLQHFVRWQAAQPANCVGHALINMPPPASQVAPGADQLEAALLETQIRIGHQSPDFETVDFAQPVALAYTSLAGC